MSTLKAHIEEVSARLNGCGSVHLASNGRVICLNHPYELPSGMDLRGIAGVSFKREQDSEIASRLSQMGDNEKQDLLRQHGRYKDGEFLPGHKMGPREAPPFEPPEFLRTELLEISEVFARLTGAKEHKIWFPNNPAPEFHIDGAVTTNPSWRLTYSFSGAQTEWHKYQRDDSTPVVSKGMIGFPIIPKDEIGQKGVDYFPSDGPLMFLTNSLNGLFHWTSEEARTDKDRFMVTMDASAPRRENCTDSCPFPCRTLQPN